MTTTAKSSLSLPGVATLSTCGTGSLSLNYTWFFSVFTPQGPSTINNKTQGKDPTTFYLPAYSLIAGRTYQAKLTVKVQDTKFNVLSSSFATASVFVAHGAIVAQIRALFSRGAGFVAGFASVKLSPLVLALGDALRVCLTLDAVIRGNRLLAPAWDKFKRLADIIRTDPAKYGADAPPRACAPTV